MDPGQFSVLIALLFFGIVLLAIIFMRFETRVDRLEDKLERATRIDRLDGKLERACDRQPVTGLSRDGLAQEFRAQRAEVAAHIAAIRDGSAR